jgi:hypothetical protein
VSKVSTSLATRRELKAARAELRRLVEVGVRRRLTDGDPAQRARLAERAVYEVARLRVKHGFLLRHLAPALFDAIEWLLLADRLESREPDYANALGLLLSDTRHASYDARIAKRIEARLAALIDAAVAEECK